MADSSNTESAQVSVNQADIFSPKVAHGYAAGMHKAWYQVKREDFPRISRERLYVQCNCNLGYDHHWTMYDNPDYDTVVTDLQPSDPNTNTKGAKAQ